MESKRCVRTSGHRVRIAECTVNDVGIVMVSAPSTKGMRRNQERRPAFCPYTSFEVVKTIIPIEIELQTLGRSLA